MRADAVSGLTVAVVALPLSMAIAIAIHSVSRDRRFHRRQCCDLPKLLSIRNALPTLHIPTVGIAIMSVVVIVILRHLRPNWPSFLIVVSVAAIVYVRFFRSISPPCTRALARYNTGQATNRDVMISGAFFFGATARVLGVLDRVGAPRLLVLDFKDVPLIDTTAARSLVAFVNKLERLGTSVVFAAARPTVRRTLNRAGLKPPLVRYSATAQDAVAMIPQ
ncbi:MAG: STAS domain-containing protein [Pseudolabrys sp.]